MRAIAITALITTLFAIFSSLSYAAEFRDLVSSDGKSTIRAKFVSHQRGKVTIERSDGLKFEVDPAVFRKQDHEAILEWMKAEASKIEYRLQVEADRKRTRLGHHASNMHYVLNITNQAQNTVEDLKVLYRLIYDRSDVQNVLEGEYLLEQELAPYRTLVLETKQIRFANNIHNRSGLRGCLVRVLDPDGGVILDWSSNELSMKDVTWDSTKPVKEEERPKPVITIQ